MVSLNSVKVMIFSVKVYIKDIYFLFSRHNYFNVSTSYNCKISKGCA
jgi:hypothetical protein